MNKLFKNSKKVFSFVVAFAILAMSLFTGVVSAAEPVQTAEGIIDLLVFGTGGNNLPGSNSPYYDDDVADNDETGDSWENAIIIDSAEEFVYLAKASGNETAGKYYKVADGIAGFDLSKGDLDLDGTLADNLDAIKASGKNHSGNTPGFQGHFDGNGVTVYGAWTNHNEGQVGNYAGLFSCTKGDVTIKNVNVRLSYFVAKNAAGGLIGYYTGAGTGTLTIENCSVADCHIEAQKTGYGSGVGALVGYAQNYSAAGNGPINVKNCFVNLDENHFISQNEMGTQTDGTLDGVHGGLLGFVVTNYDNNKAGNITDCVVIGITPYATSSCTANNNVQHSGVESHFANIYTTEATGKVAIGGAPSLGERDYTGRVFQLTADQMKGAAAVKNMNLDWSVWMADAEGYPELRIAHKDIEVVDNGDGTHSEVCACGFGGVGVAHIYDDGVCECGAELNCATRKTIYWDGTVASGISERDGDTYIINTVAELAYVLGQSKDNYAVTDGKHFKLADDIGAIVLQSEDKAADIMALDSAAAVKEYFESGSSFLEWKYYGWEQSTFCGDIDFNGVTIYGLYQKSTSNAGLISNADAGAAVHNLAIKNSYITKGNNNYQIGAVIAITNGTTHGKAKAGVIWLDGIVVANNYIYSEFGLEHNNSTGLDENNRAGVLVGASSEAVYVDNCLVYGNDATFGPDRIKMPIYGNVANAIPAGAEAPEGLETVYEGEPQLHCNMVRNSIIFDAFPYDTTQAAGNRFCAPNCYENVLTNEASGEVQFANRNGEPTYHTYEDAQLKTVTVADLATAELGDAWINTDTYPELRSFHDEVFTGAPNAQDNYAGHTAACSCGIGGVTEPHTYEVDDASLGMGATYKCTVCDFVCDHRDPNHYEYQDTLADCVTPAGFIVDCECGLHLEEPNEGADPLGHNFKVHDAVAGDCQTAGTIAYKYCDQCEKNYAADADMYEPFENALADLTGELGDHKPVTDAETGEIHYEKDDTNHWTVCSVCEEAIETSAHDGKTQPNGASGHAIVCDVCDYSSDNVPHNFIDGVCDGCSYECAHEYDGVCDTECNLCFVYREAEEHTYDNACDEECNVCHEIRWVWGHVYDGDTDAVCNECGAIRAVAAEITVDVTGAYTLTPDDGYGAEFSAADIILTDKNGTVIKFNEKFGGYPIVQGQVYVVEFTPESAANVVGEVEWNCELVTEELFRDADTDTWYTDAVAYNAGVGLITGYGGTDNFGTADNIQRQDFVVILARLAGVDLENYQSDRASFTDVPSGAYYEKAIMWAADLGITTGYAGGTVFGVGDVITREQLVTFLYRYAKYANGGTAPKVSQDAADKAAAYPDFAGVTDYAEEAIIWALDKGVISGKGGTHIAPGGNALRCEVAQMFYNIYLNDTLIPTTTANIDVFAPGEEPTTYVIDYIRASEDCFDDAYVYTWTPEFDGVLTLTPVGGDEWVVITNTANQFDGVTLDPNGPVSFNAKAGNTYEIQVMTWSESDGTAEFTATFTEGVAIMGSGTEMDPYIVTDIEMLPAIESMQTVYFMVSANPMTTYTLTVSAPMMATYDVAANMGQATGSAMGGQVVLENLMPNMMGNVMFSITNTGFMPIECMYTLSEAAASTLGTEADPDTLVLDTTTTAEIAKATYYYTYTAEEAGTLTIEILDNLCADGWVCSISGGAAEAVYQESTAETTVNPVTYAVEAGETVTIWVATAEFTPGQVYFNATFA